jgi:hypothetical protein
MEVQEGERERRKESVDYDSELSSLPDTEPETPRWRPSDPEIDDPFAGSGSGGRCERKEKEYTLLEHPEFSPLAEGIEPEIEE